MAKKKVEVEENVPEVRSEIVLRETATLMDADTLLRKPISELTEVDSLTAWSVLDLLEKEVIKARKEVLRQHLFTMAEKGEKNENGSFTYVPSGSTGKIMKQRNSGKVSLLGVDVLEEKLGKDLFSKTLIRRVLLTPVAYAELREFLAKTVGAPVSFLGALSEATISIADEAIETFAKIGLISKEVLAEIVKVEEDTWTLKVTKPKEVSGLLNKKE